MDILQELGRTTPRGPFGALRSGDATEGVSHFPEYRSLRPEDQEVVNRVWSGRRRECLVPSQEGVLLHYVKYTPAGQERAGVRYGYTVRTIATGDRPADLPGPSRSRGPTRLASALFLAVWVSGSAVVGVMLWCGLPFHRPEISTAPPSAGAAAVRTATATDESPDELRAKLLQLQRREQEVTRREAQARLDAAETARLRAVIETEAKQLRARATSLEAALPHTADGLNSTGQVEEPPSMAPPQITPSSPPRRTVREPHGGRDRDARIKWSGDRVQCRVPDRHEPDSYIQKIVKKAEP